MHPIISLSISMIEFGDGLNGNVPFVFVCLCNVLCDVN